MTTVHMDPILKEKHFEISILVPIYNEEENIPLLCQKIKEACDEIGHSYEVILVDDGSQDQSISILKNFAELNSNFKVICFRKNFGQTAALSAGLKASSGKIIIMMDGDLQNDPKDISVLLEKLDEGYDVVSGWRKDRKDAFFTRILPSRIANFIISSWTGVRLKDYGCTLKAYRQEVITDVRIYGEMHRFLPFYASLSGAKICEIPVHHHARKHGFSKYGLSRTFKVLLDLITIRFLGRYAQNPIYIFGGIGFISIFFGIVLSGFTLFQRFSENIYVHRNPLILLASLLALGGLQFLVLGLLAEILLRTYHESQGKPTYLVREVVNIPMDRVK